MSIRTTRFILAAACALGTLAAQVNAADTTSPAPTAAPDSLATPRGLIAEAKWREAIDALRAVNDTANADWNNLMGYAQRKAAAPDYPLAARYYEAALAIDAKHRGALEYSGELYLLLGDLARAEARLQELSRACFFGCKELDGLRAAVAAYKANGNKFVAQRK